MLMDGREVESGAVVRTDLCVVGAGAAGIAIAHALAGSGVDVLLLESGGFEAEAATTALNEGEIVGMPLDPLRPLPLKDTRLRYFGGTTNHWAGNCRPLEPVDFERRPSVPDSGWPFGRSELDPWYDRARDLCGLGPARFDWQWWNEHHDVGHPVLDGERVTTTMLLINQQRRQFGKDYRDTLVSAPNVRVCLWANVIRVDLAPDGSRVQGLDVATLTGRRFRAEARVYVLAAGGIETPRLLLVSDDVRPAGVGNENDLVGRYFSEHLNLVGGGAVFARSATELSLYETRSYAVAPELAVFATGVFVLTGEFRRAEALLAAQMRCALDVRSLFIVRFRGDTGKALRPEQVGALVSDVTSARGQTPSAIGCLCEQAPNPASRVRLSDARDALGVRRVALDWRLSDLDRASVLRSLAVLGEELARVGGGRVQVAASGFVPAGPDLEPLAALDYRVWTGFHHMGTTRMHGDPTRGVVDADCRVHSVPNLYVASSAVFPTSGSAGPTFTIVALALRLAAHLRDKVLG